MDARSRLRLYLEQRRELGESELTLDSLPVDDVLRMLGAPRDASAHDASARNASARDDRRHDAGAHDAASGAQNADASAHRDAMRDDHPDDNALSEPPVPEPQGREPQMREPQMREPQMRESPHAPGTSWRDVLKASGVAGNTSPMQAPGAPTPGAGENDATIAGDVHKSQGSTEPSISEPVANAGGSAAPAWLTALGIPFGLYAGGGEQIVPAPVAALDSLGAIAEVVARCRACPLGETALNPVPGEGNPHADFVCVGEAPGQNEDEQGRPFVGAAGQLLTKILLAIQLEREDVFICNVLKHRPPGNRNPMPDEVHACASYLVRQLELIRPKVILALGTFAAQTLLNTPTALGKLRGQVHRFHGIPLIATYHPAALLRNESWKRPTWDDVKLARRILDAARAASDAS